MDPLSLLVLLPQARRPSLPIAAAAASLDSRSRRISGTRLVPRRRRRAVPRPGCLSAVAAETPRTEETPSPSPSGEERFDWLDQWYPLAPVCDLDPGAPHGKTVLGLSVVAWYDRGAGEWRVFDDACSHRLAPLSEGRIDDKGRLQCVYHGWCFDGAGTCKFIPQAPALGPPVHKNSKACVASYPCVVQNNILWFYPSAEPKYKDVLQRKRPPFIAEIDDSEFVTVYGIRDLFCGYDVLVENLMDPAHVPYAHKGLMRGIRKKEDTGRYVPDLIVEYDTEGGGLIKMKIEQANIEGFLSPQEWGYFQFVAPCTFFGSPSRQEADQGKKKALRVMLVFFCVPVSTGRSRVIWAFPRNVGFGSTRSYRGGSTTSARILYWIQTSTSSTLRSANLPRQALITGRKLAMCPHRQTAWSSPSETGSENSARIRSAGLPHNLISCHQPLTRISSWRGTGRTSRSARAAAPR